MGGGLQFCTHFCKLFMNLMSHIVSNQINAVNARQRKKYIQFLLQIIVCATPPSQELPFLYVTGFEKITHYYSTIFVIIDKWNGLSSVLKSGI